MLCPSDTPEGEVSASNTRHWFVVKYVFKFIMLRSLLLVSCVEISDTKKSYCQNWQGQQILPVNHWISSNEWLNVWWDLLWRYKTNVVIRLDVFQVFIEMSVHVKLAIVWKFVHHLHRACCQSWHFRRAVWWRTWHWWLTSPQIWMSYPYLDYVIIWV